MRTPRARWFTALLVVMLGTPAWGKDPQASTKAPRLIELTKLQSGVKHAPGDALSADGWARLRGSRDVASVDQGPTKYLAVNLEFVDAATCKALKVNGTHPITQFDRFADLFVPAGNEEIVKAIANSPGLIWLEVARSAIVPPPVRVKPQKEKSRQIPDQIVRGGFNGLTGKGVIVAVVDSGIDFHHPDFITYDSSGAPTSRILYFWDTLSDAYANGEVGKEAPVTYPNGAPIGTIFSRDELTAELRGSRPRISEWDTNGHGTACACIAAGNGNGAKKKYSGVAPEADIIAVRIGGRGADGGLENSYLINAIADWVDKVAGKSPAVMSCSFGGHVGGHDGFRVEERQLSARFANDRVGRAICIAAGNEGADRMHCGKTLKGMQDQSIVSWEAPAGALLNLYLQADSLDDLWMATQGDTKLSGDEPMLHPLTKQVVLTLFAEPGAGSIALATKSGKPVDIDAYIYGNRVAFSPDCATAAKMVGSPGTAAGAITVGSYDWNDIFDQQGQQLLVPDFTRDAPIRVGLLSSYSSPGPVRIGGVVKPEIAAPGQWWVAAAPLNVYSIRDTTGQYQLFNGTSAATPYMSGIVALVMQKKPTITVGELKGLLKTAATTDSFTGAVPNGSWGNGKLDINAVKKLISSVGATASR